MSRENWKVVEGLQPSYSILTAEFQHALFVDKFAFNL